jgi:hypothetical protein
MRNNDRIQMSNAPDLSPLSPQPAARSSPSRQANGARDDRYRSSLRRHAADEMGTADRWHIRSAGGWGVVESTRHSPRVCVVSILAAALLTASGCTSDEQRHEPGPPQDWAGSSASSTPDAVASPADPAAPWYQRARVLDLTGDGRRDSVHIEAHGTLPDSARVILAIFVDGVEKHREEWGSSYELALVDSAARALPRAETVLRAKLDTVLESVSLRRIGAADMRLMAEDSAPLSRLSGQPGHGVSFS